MLKARVTEISAVDKPAQSDALVVLRKNDHASGRPASAPIGLSARSEADAETDYSYQHVLAAAEYVMKGGSNLATEVVTRERCQQAQMDFVEAGRRPGETTANATLRLISHPTVKMLDQAWRRVQAGREFAASEALSKARSEGHAPVDVRTRTSAGYVTRGEIDAEVRRAAEQSRRPGETSEQAYVRVLRECPELYEAYRQASR